MEEIKAMNHASYQRSVKSRQFRLKEVLTRAIEIVARAKGSPRILDIWIPLRRPYMLRLLSIFISDGELREP